MSIKITMLRLAAVALASPAMSGPAPAGPTSPPRTPAADAPAPEVAAAEAPAEEPADAPDEEPEPDEDGLVKDIMTTKKTDDKLTGTVNVRQLASDLGLDDTEAGQFNTAFGKLKNASTLGMGDFAVITAAFDRILSADASTTSKVINALRKMHKTEVSESMMVPEAAMDDDEIARNLKKHFVIDGKHMVKDGKIEVTCEFCSSTYEFKPDEVGANDAAQ